MKIKGLYLGIVAAVAMSVCAPTVMFRAEAQNPGIAVAGSESITSLPKGAKHFMDKHFKGVAVRSCEKKYVKGTYEVEFANGVEIEFSSKGKPMEMDAPDGMFLPVAMVQDVLPGKAFKRLQDKGLAQKVESIEFDKHGKAVEVEVSIPDPDTYIFDINGDIIEITD